MAADPRTRAATGRTLRTGLFVMVLCIAGEGRTSDKGIHAEMVTGAVSVFCGTSIADDLGPLMDQKKRLARSKVSPEKLKSEQRKMDARWRSVAEKHRVAIEESGLSARLANVRDDSDTLRGAAQDAWEIIQGRCPARAQHASAGAVEEFLSRRLADLAKPRAP